MSIVMNQLDCRVVLGLINKLCNVSFVTKLVGDGKNDTKVILLLLLLLLVVSWRRWFRQ